LKRKEHSNLILRGQHYPDTKAYKDHIVEENVRPVSLNEHSGKYTHQKIVEENSTTYQNHIDHDHVGFSSALEEWFNTC
jgi:hypothetical protein